MAIDITEEFQLDLSAVASENTTVDSNVLYDLSFNNLGFFLGNGPENPIRRETAQYRKDQSDNANEPGEQSLSGWWLRSQSSFHLGAGIKFYEPAQDDKLRFRFAESRGVDPWTAGEVSLLPAATQGHAITNSTATVLQSIHSGTTDAVLMLDGHDVDKIWADGTVTHFIDYNAGTDEPVYGICNDGTYAYWLTNNPITGVQKSHFYKKLLSGTSATAETQFHKYGTEAVSSGFMEWVKERPVACVNNKIYELNPNASTSTDPVLVYEHPNTGTVYTGITASGTNIYVSGYNGLQGFILKLVLDANGGLVPTLDGAVVAAELPRGEIVHTIKYYLGYMLIGTSYGARVAQVSDAGDIIYGPLIFTSNQPVYQFACDDHFAWCAAGVGNEVGIKRIDLSAQIDTLVFPWSDDRVVDGVNVKTTGVAFIGNSDKLAYSGAANYVYVDSNNLRSSGSITTGGIRYNTLENKHFKYIADRALYTESSIVDIAIISKDGTSSDIANKNASTGNSDSAIDPGSEEFVQFKFTLHRDTADTTIGPKLYGYQVKAVPATPRQRLIQYPLYCFDTETDRYNNRSGYDGQANEKLLAIEQLENVGDFVNVTDYRTGETYSGLIEEVSFMGMTPPDRRFDGVGGLLKVTVRKI
jgi:hypothetical protein